MHHHIKWYAKIFTPCLSTFFSQKDIYLTMLNSQNKFHKKLVSEEPIKVQKLFFEQMTHKQERSCPVEFLFQVRGLRLFGVQNLDYLQKWAFENIDELSNNKDRFKVCAFFVEQRRCNVTEQLLKLCQNLSTQQKLLKNYFSAICQQKLGEESPIIAEIGQKFQNQWKEQLHFLKLMHIKQVRLGDKVINKKRSPLQIQIQSLLHALELKYQRQVMINGIRVDFLIQNRQILEVLGPHHFTVMRNHKGREVMRRLVLQQWFPVKFVDYQQINHAIGIQNKLQLLQNILENDKIC